MYRTDLSVEQGETYPIYLFGDSPFWFVPSKSAHELLQLWLKGKEWEELVNIWSRRSGLSRAASELDLQKLFDVIVPPFFEPYTGRKSLKLERLTEVWLHITEACNLACRHCLFGEKQKATKSLNLEQILSVMDETYALGARLFCFTGGEPFMHPAFQGILEKALEYSDARVVTLTNGTFIKKNITKLKKLDYRRMHFQVSIDGLDKTHDRLRGNGTFFRTVDALKLLVDSRIPCSIAMSVNEQNVHDMAKVVKLAYEIGVQTIHFLWHFKRGKGQSMEIVPAETLIPHFKEAMKMSEKTGVLIDNVEALRAQVFTPPGTRFDFGNGAWESLAIGPDGSISPTPAMVGMSNLCGRNIRDGVEYVWQNSHILKQIREISLIDIPDMKRDPWRFILGGGDLDHCIVGSDDKIHNIKVSDDPYVPLYKHIAMTIIEKEALELPKSVRPGLILRMGDVIHECPTTADVNFTHCNCLLSMGEGGIRGLVRQFYEKRSHKTDETIVNPVSPGSDFSRLIPEEVLMRSYGCGSPVEDAQIAAGETVLDLGCGTGVECVIASGMVGKEGKVIGIDMTDQMLVVASKAKNKAEQTLEHSNMAFLKGFLEDVPLKDSVAEVVISNCVINLTRNKRRVFREIARVLKPGGRMVISDVVTKKEPPLSIRTDHKLTGECIGGAMVQSYLFSVLEDMGFTDVRLIKRFPYRIVNGHRFYSLTFSAVVPNDNGHIVSILYRGPPRAVVIEDGTVLRKGIAVPVSLRTEVDENKLSQEGLFIVDEKSGTSTNLDAESNCSCSVPYDAHNNDIIPEEIPVTGCLLCGKPLVYLSTPQKKICVRCGNTAEANAICEKGHFVCDICHIQDPIDAIKKVCLTSKEEDMIRLLHEIRSHKKIPLHGPEHHAIVPGIILATYRNLGGNITEEQILTGIRRGTQIPGGSCGFMRVCGAATGVGIAYSIILDSNPVAPEKRQKIQKVVSRVISRISEQKAARCCQRECYIASKEAASVSSVLLPIVLKADFHLTYQQHSINRECIGVRCLLQPERVKGIVHQKKGKSEVQGINNLKPSSGSRKRLPVVSTSS